MKKQEKTVVVSNNALNRAEHSGEAVLEAYLNATLNADIDDAEEIRAVGLTDRFNEAFDTFDYATLATFRTVEAADDYSAMIEALKEIAA